MMTRRPAQAKKTYIFNSFFYHRLTEKRGAEGREKSYNLIKSWTAKADLFNKAYVIIPINEK